MLRDGNQWRISSEFASKLNSWHEGKSLKPVHKRIHGRQFVILFGFAMAFVLVSVRIALIAWAEPEEPYAVPSNTKQWTERVSIVDRNGAVLAMNLSTHSLFAHPREMSGKESIRQAVEKLAGIFDDIDVERLAAQLSDGRKFMWIKREMTPEQQQAVHDLGEPGLYMGPRETRIYPKGTLFSHILGGISFGEEGSRFVELIGSAGVEKYFDQELQDPARDGEPLRLSVDQTVQFIIEKTLAASMKVYRAIAASAVLMDVHTGEILALVSLPQFDPNDRGAYFDRDAGSQSPLFFKAVHGVYELGSTFKTFAAAQALELGLVTPDTQISNKLLEIKGRKFRGKTDSETLSVTDLIAKSSNAATARLALSIGTNRQKQFLDALGLFDPTTLELGEASHGKPLLPQRWKEIETATISYGHGMSVNPVHLAAAYAILANGGYSVQPTLIKDGSRDFERTSVISPKTSEQIVEILRHVVTDGTATAANLSDYSVGGKTGTAEKPNPRGGYHKDKFISTFASVFPTEDVRYVLVVSLDEPITEERTYRSSAGKTAVPTSAKIITDVAPILGLKPSRTSTAPES